MSIIEVYTYPHSNGDKKLKKRLPILYELGAERKKSRIEYYKKRDKEKGAGNLVTWLLLSLPGLVVDITKPDEERTC